MNDQPDPNVERAVTSWLHDEPDRVPDGLADGALARSRATAQRPTWQARWHDRGGLRLPQQLAAGAAVTAALVLIAVVVGLSVWRDAANTGASAPSEAPAPTTIPLDADATALGSGFGSLWVGDDTSRLVRINPTDGSIEATIELDGVPCGPIAPASTSLWLATCGVGGTTTMAKTTRVDPATNSIVNVYDDGAGDGFGASAMNGLVWFISDVDAGRITAVDALTGEHVRDLTIDSPIHHLTAGFGSLWVNPIGRPAVLRIDPETGDTLAEITLSGDSGYLTTSADSIWVAEPHQWLVARIDPTTDRVAAELMAAPGADHIAVASNGRVWALTDDQLFAFDPAGNQEVDRLAVPSHRAFDDIATHVLALDEDRVWFADGSSLERLRPDD
jgi:hypothetical protein